MPETAGRAWRTPPRCPRTPHRHPQASTLAVGNAAAAFAWLITEPIFAKSVAAADTHSGAAETKDIADPFRQQKPRLRFHPGLKAIQFCRASNRPRLSEQP
jgi:hypothetical protein